MSNTQVTQMNLEDIIRKIYFITDDNFLTKNQIDDINFFWPFIKTLFDQSFIIKDRILLFDSSYFTSEKKTQIMNYVGLESTRKNYLLSAFPFGENRKYFIVCKTEDKILLNNNDVRLYIEEEINKIKLMYVKKLNDLEKKNNNNLKIERILMPTIKSSEIDFINNNSIKISFNEINILQFYKKNMNKILSFIYYLEKLENDNEKIDNNNFEYILILFDLKNFKYESITKYEIINKKVIFEISNLINSNLYSYGIITKYDNFYSKLSNLKFFYSFPSRNNLSSIYIYGENNLYSIKSDYINSFKKLPCKFYNLSYYKSQTFLINQYFDVINCGWTFLNEKKDCFEIIKTSNYNINYKYKIGEPLKLIFPSNKDYIKKISIGKNFIIALDFYGQCFSLGENYYGQLGLGLEENIIVGVMKKINFNERNIFIYDISCSKNNVISFGFGKKKNYLYFWGLNFFNNNQGNYNSPIILNYFNDQNVIKLISKFNYHGIITYDKENNNNLLYLLESIEDNFFSCNNYNENSKEKDDIENNNKIPYLIYFFKLNNISVLDVKFEKKYYIVIGYNNKINKKEIYLKGEIEFMKKKYEEYTKFEREFINDIIDVLPSKNKIFFLLKNYTLKIISEKEENINIYDNEKKDENIIWNKYNDAKLQGDDLRVFIIEKNINN